MSWVQPGEYDRIVETVASERFAEWLRSSSGSRPPDDDEPRPSGDPTDPRFDGYLARKQAQGKTRKEAIRCLKRHLARRIWRLLRTPSPAPPTITIHCP